MDAVEALVGSLPEWAEQIRQRYWRDAEFREVCGDYRDVLEVLARLEQAVPPDAARLAEYRGLAAELLDHALEILREADRR